MKKIPFFEESVASLAVKDASNFGLTASLLKEGDSIFLTYEESKACYEDKNCAPDYADIYRSVRNDLDYELKWIREDIRYQADRINAHMAGHLPPIKDVGLMNKAIKSLGLEDSFIAEKARVYVEY